MSLSTLVCPPDVRRGPGREMSVSHRIIRLGCLGDSSMIFLCRSVLIHSHNLLAWLWFLGLDSGWCSGVSTKTPIAACAEDRENSINEYIFDYTIKLKNESNQMKQIRSEETMHNAAYDHDHVSLLGYVSIGFWMDGKSYLLWRDSTATYQSRNNIILTIPMHPAAPKLTTFMLYNSPVLRISWTEWTVW